MKELIKGSYLFSDLSDDEIEELSALAVEQSFQVGENIIQAYKTNDSIWFLQKGTASVKDRLPNGLEIDLFPLKKGDVFGEISFADSLPASATVVALGETQVLRIRFRELKTFFYGRPKTEIKVLRKLVVTLSQRLRRANTAIKKGFEVSLGWLGEDDQ